MDTQQSTRASAALTVEINLKVSSTSNPPFAALEKKHILLIGNDPLLAFTRRQILEIAGCKTTSCDLPFNPPANLRDIDLAILCRSIEPIAAATIAAEIGLRSPRTPVIRFEWGGEPDCPYITRSFAGLITGAALLAEVARAVRGASAPRNENCRSRYLEGAA